MKVREIIVKIDEIDSILKKQDAIIVYLKNGKYWVCEKVIRFDYFYKLTLKGKCENK